MTSSAAARPGAALIESAAQTVLHRGLRDGKSAFTPEKSVWTAQAADELDRFYVQRLNVGAGNFVQKLQGQLDGASPSAVQLAAELLYLNALPLSNVSGKAKRARINAVLSWLPEPVAIPSELDVPLDTGVFSGGVGFNTMLWSQLVHLVAFVQTWCALDQQTRDRALNGPWAWKEFVESVGGGNAPSQRNALKYLAFPATFEPIVNVSHRQRIRAAYKNLLPGPPGDVDRDLLTIRQKLQEQSPGVEVEFYGPPWAAAWKTGKSATVGRHAWLVRPGTSGRPETVLEWTDGGYIALPADRLRQLPAGTSLDAVRDAVSSDYSSTDYVRQSELADTFHAVLTSMKPNDILATATGDSLQLGVVGDDAPVFETVDGAVRLRRNATWHTTDNPLPIADLPAPLPTHLATPGPVVDLSQDLDLLLALMQEDAVLDEEDDVTLTTAEVVEGEQPTLKDATDELAADLHVDKDFLQECIDLLTDRQQMIFYGPPGTGKTYIAERLARFLADAGALESERVALVQFHPSTSYEDFVEGYRPGEGDSEGKLSFKLTPGPFSRLVSAAAGDLTRPYFLLIDEINRANLAKVFGELYYLLEYRDSGIRLLYRPGKPFTLPRNVFVIGTMNTADRSIALVDAAMRRRFAFVELHPDLDPVKSLLRRWLKKKRKNTERADLLDALNARIADREFKIGPSYLMKADADRAGGLTRVWKYSILPLLVEHHYGRLSPTQVEQKYGIAALRADVVPTPTESTEPRGPVEDGTHSDEP